MGVMRNLMGTALKGAKQVATDLVARGIGRAGAGGGAGGGATELRATWRAVGSEQERRWNAFALEIQGQWRDQEALARRTAGGELFAGLWLAVGEMVTEAWQRAGRDLATGWSRALGSGDWSQTEAVLDAALEDAWSSFQPIWGLSRPRLQEILERMSADPHVAELQKRIDAAFSSAEQQIEATWLEARAPFKAALRALLEPPGQRVGNAELEAAWQAFSGPLEQAWRRSIEGLEAVLR